MPQFLQTPLVWLAAVLAASALVFAVTGRGPAAGIGATASSEEESVLFSRPAAAKDQQLGAEALPASAPIDLAQPAHFETASFALG